MEIRNSFVVIDVIRFIIRIHKNREFSVRKWFKFDFEKHGKITSNDFRYVAMWLEDSMKKNFVLTGSTALLVRGIIKEDMSDVDITVKTKHDYEFLLKEFPYHMHWLDIEIGELDNEVVQYGEFKLPCARIDLIKRRYVISSIKGLFYSLSYVKKYILRLKQLEVF